MGRRLLIVSVERTVLYLNPRGILSSVPLIGDRDALEDS